tara:strand:+ start:4037 stop:4507 length:471 start_codon:yes stop_codon:yes gene_type:complete
MEFTSPLTGIDYSYSQFPADFDPGFDIDIKTGPLGGDGIDFGALFKPAQTQPRQQNTYNLISPQAALGLATNLGALGARNQQMSAMDARRVALADTASQQGASLAGAAFMNALDRQALNDVTAMDLGPRGRQLFARKVRSNTPGSAYQKLVAGRFA